MKLWKRNLKGEGQEENLQCSFCQKSHREVKKLVAGPHVHICDECVAMCVDAMASSRTPNPDQASGETAGIDATCGLCHRGAERAFEIPGRGVLCQSCVLAVQSVTVHSLL